MTPPPIKQGERTWSARKRKEKRKKQIATSERAQKKKKNQKKVFVRYDNKNIMYEEQQYWKMEMGVVSAEDPGRSRKRTHHNR